MPHVGRKIATLIRTELRGGRTASGNSKCRNHGEGAYVYHDA